MATTFEIPLSSTPQQFSALFPDGNTYTIRLIYQFDADNCWLLDLSDANDDPLVCGIPVITGADLLAQYAYLFATPFSLFALTDGDLAEPPHFYNLGTTGHIRVSTPAGA